MGKGNVCVFGEVEKTAILFQHTKGSKLIFEYGGRLFIPYRLFTKAENTFDFISRHIARDPELGFMSKGCPESKTSYSYAEFFKRSSIKDCDLFVCAENGKLYCPGENELFEWQGEVGKSDFDRKSYAKSQKEKNSKEENNCGTD